MEETNMNKDQVEGSWEQMKGKAKILWGKLTDEELTKTRGERQELIGKLQERYGYAKQKAESEVTKFMDSCGCSSEKKQSM